MGISAACAVAAISVSKPLTIIRFRITRPRQSPNCITHSIGERSAVVCKGENICDVT
uniref:Uncharacterized protein n=1 Tax=Pseudomonas marincola TaxID=437900 RepID=A0A653E3E6_9PSED